MQNAFSFAMGFLVVSLISASAYFYFDPEKLTPTITEMPVEEVTASVTNSVIDESDNGTTTTSTSTSVSSTTTGTSTSNN